jgi:hypothetical protein
VYIVSVGTEKKIARNGALNPPLSAIRLLATLINRLKLYISKHLMAQERCTRDLALKPTNRNRELQALFAFLPESRDVIQFLSFGALPRVL